MQSRVQRLARDQAAISRPDLPGQPKTMVKDQETQISDPSGGGTPPSGEECIQFVKLCMQGLEGDELQTFLSGLNDLLSTGAGAPMGAGDDAPNNNLQVLDRASVAVRRSARDNQMVRPKAMDAKFAVRGMNAASAHKSFASRFPEVMKNVDVWR